MKEERYIIKVTGKVQGVFYRKHTKEKALQLGLKGIVKNKDDGSVYIEAIGAEDAILSLIEWCKKGSPEAQVRDVSYYCVEEKKDYDSFRIITD